MLYIYIYEDLYIIINDMELCQHIFTGAPPEIDDHHCWATDPGLSLISD